MRKLSALCLLLLSAPAHAEVFKCVGKFGKTEYQASPCAVNSQERQLDIKTTPDPAEEAAAKAKLEAVQAEYQAQKSADEKLQAEQNKQAAAAMDLARRNAIIQQQQLEAQQRQQEEFKRQNKLLFRPLDMLQ